MNWNINQAGTKMDQLDLELRMLKDENYRIREEQLRLEREMKDPAFRTSVGPFSSRQSLGVQRAGGGGDGASRVDLEQQLTYTQELIRSLQGENLRLRGQLSVPAAGQGGPGGAGGAAWGAGSGQGGRGGAGAEASRSEASYRQLRERLASLQQAHLQQLQDQRQAQPGVAPPRTSFSAVQPARGSYPSAYHSRASSAYGGGPPAAGQSDPELRAQLQALQQEQELLRGKVRKLARN